MFHGTKEHRHLALGVAIALSGSGLLFASSAAEAAHVVHIASTDTSHGGGVNGTNETGFNEDNEITVGAPGAG